MREWLLDVHRTIVVQLEECLDSTSTFHNYIVRFSDIRKAGPLVIQYLYILPTFQF